jgi:lipopolysaccharide/colanic/teichoic acid biosynthesis glycosyltransferase
MTKFGRRLRSLSLDELPELWNIFTGKMSIVGPRPQLVKDLVFFDDEIAKRQSVRPGLTGLAQVSGRNNATWDERFACDLKYVQKITFWGDLKILFKTVGKVFARSDVATDGMDTSEDYGDYLLRLGRIDQATYDEKVAKSKEMIKEFLG